MNRLTFRTPSWTSAGIPEWCYNSPDGQDYYTAESEDPVFDLVERLAMYEDAHERVIRRREHINLTCRIYSADDDECRECMQRDRCAVIEWVLYLLEQEGGDGQ